ncbi:MAG: hypothetical protein JRG76_05085 [Deltaproteobacteria bacterium]|nr:hypothetical protein [Deltaproteobacteria bacterium]MBW2413866.1 hypothetical protein [Deltaproteobacteria bacterium]
MDHDALAERRRALENEFFAKRDRELIERMHEEHEVADLSHIEDQVLVEQLVALGITAKMLAALGLIPLLAVAWADGRVDKAERVTILDAATAAGVDRHAEGYAMLEHWLDEPPRPGLFDAWKGYVAEVARPLAPNLRKGLRDEVLRLARTVAEASGGFLGLGERVSAEERAVLARIEEAFAAD